MLIAKGKEVKISNYISPWITKYRAQFRHYFIFIFGNNVCVCVGGGVFK